MSVWKAKRFWKQASVGEADTGFTIMLDGKPVHTPGKRALIVPTRALADAIAVEWDAQVEVINPETMPLTRAANSAIEKVAPQRQPVREMLAEYGDTDLVCYRSEGPVELTLRQAAAWDPVLDWAAERFGARLFTITGVMYDAQSQETLEKLARPLKDADDFRLTGMHDLITISGSLVLGLAVSERHIPAKDAWELARVDEIWQQEQWGADEEAVAASARKRDDFLRAERLLDLLDA